MSYYTSTGITVAPNRAKEFVEFIGGKDATYPTRLTMGWGGSVTATWEDFNHFQASDTYVGLRGLLNQWDDDEYNLQVIDEDFDVVENCGGYSPDFEFRVSVVTFGDEITLDHFTEVDEE